MIKGGDLWNEDIGDMLRIYNVDYQGLISKLYINKFAFGFMSIGDLSRNVGLDLHQTYKFSTEYNSGILRTETSITINELVTHPNGLHPTKADVNIANYSAVTFSPYSKLEGQVDLRINNKLPGSFAGGLRFNYTRADIKLISSLRYYSQNFNLGYNGDFPQYYWPNSTFVGPQLYPLKNFYRNLSQWALYTLSSTDDLLTFELTASWKKKLIHKLSGYVDLDLNYLYEINSRKSSVFPIYNLGFLYNFAPVFNAGISFTNKHMDLTKEYQTAAISKAPFLSLSVNIKLGKIPLKTGLIRL
ncbi:MAG: hypothetical protein IPO65_06950 [Saprospiraceae bacterium]|nr:hypothetical protein [Saprospiraceae bacterium]